jgi:ribulose-5-phosphate 4-epimerase/fuculose-1-phosphate aldolase
MLMLQQVLRCGFTKDSSRAYAIERRIPDLVNAKDQVGDEEGKLIHEALGNNRTILLAHHGQLCACSTIEEAAVLSVFIERAARMQLWARAAGKIKNLKLEAAKEAHD